MSLVEHISWRTEAADRTGRTVFEILQRMDDLAGDRRIVEGFGGLVLAGIDHDEIDQMARHPHVMRAQRACRRLGKIRYDDLMHKASSAFFGLEERKILSVFALMRKSESLKGELYPKI